MQTHTIIEISRFSLAIVGTVAGDQLVHIEEVHSVRVAFGSRAECIKRETEPLVRMANPLEIGVSRFNEWVCALRDKIIRDHSAVGEFACRLRMPFKR